MEVDKKKKLRPHQFEEGIALCFLTIFLNILVA